MTRKAAIMTNAIPVNRSVSMRGMKLAAVRPIWCPATDITNVIVPNRSRREPGGVSSQAQARAGG